MGSFTRSFRACRKGSLLLVIGDFYWSVLVHKFAWRMGLKG